MALGTVTVTFSPGPIDNLAPISNPLGIEDVPSLHDPVEVLIFVPTHVEDASLAYFATALIMVVLFEPLKRRIDAFVEAIFFRQDEGVPDETGTEASEGACAE